MGWLVDPLVCLFSLGGVAIFLPLLQAFLLLPEMRTLRGNDAATAPPPVGSSSPAPESSKAATSTSAEPAAAAAITLSGLWCAWSPDGHEAATDINRWVGDPLHCKHAILLLHPPSPPSSRILSPSERKASRRALLDSKASGPSTPSLPSSSDPLSVDIDQAPPEMQRVALAGVTLRVPQGALCAVIGRVGSGKSTLMQVGLAGMVSVSSCDRFTPRCCAGHPRGAAPTARRRPRRRLRRLRAADAVGAFGYRPRQHHLRAALRR